jgi:GNAT superfamily N-acetyltransferase
MAQIRQATTDDVPALLPLVQDYWSFEDIPGFESQRVAAQLARLLEEPRLGGGWIACVDDAAVGYLLAVYLFSLEHLGLTAEIDEFFVVPQHRGQGIGCALLESAEATFIRAGYDHVSLQLSRRNDSARAYYHRQGYSERSNYELLEKILRNG